MNLNNILNNFNNFKSSFRKRKHLKRTFLKFNNNTKDFFLMGAIINASFLGCLFFCKYNGILQTDTIGVSLIISGFIGAFIGAFCQAFYSMFISDHEDKNKTFTSMARNYCFPKKIEELTILFNKSLNNKEEGFISDIKKIENIIYYNHVEEYNKKNKKGLFYFLNSTKSYDYAAKKMSKLDFFDIILYVFEKSKAEDFEKINSIEIEKILGNFNVKQQVELSRIINEKITNKNLKLKKINENLTFLNKNQVRGIK
jgi:phosphate/sulfate permease